MAFLISLIAQLASSAVAVVELPDLTLGSKRAGLVGAMEARGVVFECREAKAFDPPDLPADICEGKTERGAVVFLFSESAAKDARLIAASYAYPNDKFAELRQALEAELGKPSRQSTDRQGQSFIWLRGASQISLRPQCSAEHLCIEASRDAVARRLARSSGVFVITRPGY